MRKSTARDSAGDADLLDTLWVGNIPSDTVSPDLKALFAKHGALDCAAMHGPRSYGFVFFRSVDEARAARNALQGAMFHGNSIKIEFARPAKPCKYLWVGGIGSSVTKEQLKDEFLKFGKIEEFTFLRDRNSAVIVFVKIDDAIAAKKKLDRKKISEEQIRVDFLRPQPSKVELPEHPDSRDGRLSSRSLGASESWMPSDGMRNSGSYLGLEKHQLYSGRRDGQPSNVLWVGYPPSFPIDEERLHNAMILFGEIERLKCFPSRHYCFVEFRSVDEARRAKEGLQGRLFGEPRIQIYFSSSDLAPSKDSASHISGHRGNRAEMFAKDPAFGQLEFSRSSRTPAPNNFPGLLPLPSSIPGPSVSSRPQGAQGFDTRYEDSDFNDFGGAPPKFSDESSNSPIPQTKRYRSPSGPVARPSTPGRNPHVRPIPGGWEGSDIRKPKRSRVDDYPASLDTSFHDRMMNEDDFRDPYIMSDSERNGFARGHKSSVVSSVDELHGSPRAIPCWRGIIAKGGIHVCHARCVPIRMGIVSPFPEVINCSARTGLDMLTKYYSEANGFEIVFFLPDSEEDFASYTEFLRYLGSKNRAGVAKLEDGTTLFLVPPSEFLTQVLNVSGPERLYGVVLNLPQQSAGPAVQQSHIGISAPSSHYTNRVPLPILPKGPNVDAHNEDQTLKVDNRRSLYEDPMTHAVVRTPQLLHTNELQVTRSVHNDFVTEHAATSQEVSLTPELLATLASLIPSNTHAKVNGTTQMPSTSFVNPVSFSASAMCDISTATQGWMHEYQPSVGATIEQPRLPLQPSGRQLMQNSTFPSYANAANGPDHAVQAVQSSAQFQDPASILPQNSSISSIPLNNYLTPSQAGQLVTRSDPQYYAGPSGSHDNYGTVQPMTSHGVFNLSAQHQFEPAVPSSGHSQIGLLQPQDIMAVHSDEGNRRFPDQGMQLRANLSSSVQGTPADSATAASWYSSCSRNCKSTIETLQVQVKE
ncbi:hypothetical protein J5N97_022204 [Dioscorea zingiberensis]|uniref:RRM domain-containing protein n=1 Tax=Dioscorea zingiberensis TaxID=325984 RepID=A0A9D5CB22_9LILI|nr:hypothetical protein J5N97_022204 [Dioscorea zingiberensis]